MWRSQKPAKTRRYRSKNEKLSKRHTQLLLLSAKNAKTCRPIYLHISNPISTQHSIDQSTVTPLCRQTLQVCTSSTPITHKINQRSFPLFVLRVLKIPIPSKVFFVLFIQVTKFAPIFFFFLYFFLLLIIKTSPVDGIFFSTFFPFFFGI